MNVAIFASAFHPSLGGVEELCRQLAQDYRRQGMDAIVLTNRWPRQLPDYEDFEGIPLYRLPFRIPEGSLKAKLNYWLTHQQICKEMFSILQKHKIDVLHVQCVSANGYYAMLAKKILRVPLVVTAQGERTMDANRIFETSAFMNQTLRSLMQEADYVTACSRDTLQDIERFAGQPLGERAQVVYNGIRLDDFAAEIPFKHPRPYILGIGRLVPQKGFDVLIEAFCKASLEGYDLLLAGDGSEKQQLEEQIIRNGARDKIHLIGRADRSRAISLFKGCEFFVLPSRLEPMGIVNLEAMAAGKAVIASRTGGVPEIVEDGKTGMLVPPEDVDALSTSLFALANDKEMRDRMATAGKERAKLFDWPAIGEQYRAVYREVIAEGRK